MAVYRAKVSFSGLISMAKGEEREIESKEIAEDLLDADYIEFVYGEGTALDEETVEEIKSEENAEKSPEKPSEDTADEEALEEEKTEKKKGRK